MGEGDAMLTHCEEHGCHRSRNAKNIDEGDVMFTHCEEHGCHEEQPSKALAHYQKNGRSPEVVNCSRYASLQEETSLD